MPNVTEVMKTSAGEGYFTSLNAQVWAIIIFSDGNQWENSKNSTFTTRT